MSNISNFLNQAGVSRPVAAFAIANQAPVLVGPKGKALQASITDYASVGNKGTAIQAATAFSSVAASAAGRQSIVQAANGDLYFVAPTASVGATIYHYSASGSLIGSVATTWAAVASTLKMFLLSSGNICLISVVAGGNCQYAIFTPTLVSVASGTIGTGSGTSPLQVDSCPLSGGGFAVVYAQSGNIMFGTFSNTGAAVYALTNIKSSAAGFVRIAQLSSGNLVISIAQTTGGLFHGVYSTTGTIISALANLNATSASGAAEIGVGPGYYHISYANSGAVYVRANAGTGSTSYSISGALNNAYQTKFLTDGISIFLVWGAGTTLVNVTIASLDGTTATTFGIVTTGFTGSMDAILFPGDNIVAVTWQTATQVQYVVFDIPNSLAYTAQTTFGGAITTSGAYIGMANVGDYSACLVWDTASPAGTNFGLLTICDKAFLGVSIGAVAAGAQAQVTSGGGAFGFASLMGGTYGKTFDHSSTTVPGNKGWIGNGGVSQKGI